MRRAEGLKERSAAARSAASAKQTLPQKVSRFCFSVSGYVKMLRLALTVTPMTLFIIAQAPEPYIVITGFEVTVTFFFIILYMLRLDQLIDWLFWPLLDIINSVVTAIFMIIISVLALIPETTKSIVLGGVCGLLAVACCIADGALTYRKLQFNPSVPYQKKPIHDKT